MTCRDCDRPVQDGEEWAGLLCPDCWEKFCGDLFWQYQNEELEGD